MTAYRDNLSACADRRRRGAGRLLAECQIDARRYAMRHCATSEIDDAVEENAASIRRPSPARAADGGRFRRLAVHRSSAPTRADDAPPRVAPRRRRRSHRRSARRALGPGTAARTRLRAVVPRRRIISKSSLMRDVEELTIAEICARLTSRPRPPRRACAAHALLMREYMLGEAAGRRLQRRGGAFDFCSVAADVCAAAFASRFLARTSGTRARAAAAPSPPARRAGRRRQLRGTTPMLLDWALASLHHLAVFTLAAIIAFEFGALPRAPSTMRRSCAWRGSTRGMASSQQSCWRSERAAASRSSGRPTTWPTPSSGRRRGCSSPWGCVDFADPALPGVAAAVGEAHPAFTPDAAALRSVRRALWAEVALFAGIPVPAAAAMARGYGM